MFTDRRSAELIKYAANAFLATKITFINEIADLAEKVGADVQEVARGIGLDNRIGAKFLHAGPGYGGSCFPKDTRALLKTAQETGAALRIVDATVSANDVRKNAMAGKLLSALGGKIDGKTVAVLGLTFKPNTDDMREAPSIPLIAALQKHGAAVRAYDPAGMEQAKPLLEGVTFCADAYECAKGASALVIVTEWEQFRDLDFTRLKEEMAQPILVDLRNVYKPHEVTRYGFKYESVGRGRK
jgi:UDPglucose 6-dehydrogenase